MMKVLHVIDSGGLYGAEIMLLHLMLEQIKMGMTPILASIGKHGEAEKFVEAEACRRNFSVRRFRMHPGPNLSGAIRILQYARRENVDLFHTHGYKANILFGLMPRVIRPFPIVATLHGWTWVGGLDRIRFYEWLESVSFLFVDRVVLVNDGIKEHPWLRKLAKPSISIVENGIPLEKPVHHEKLRSDIVNFTKRGFTICSIGRLSPEKGFNFLIEVFADLIAAGHDYHLVILGEGQMRSALEKQVAEIGISDRLLLPGYVADAARYLPLFNLFAMPSLTEGLPMVLLEAMAAGTPIVATRVGGVARVLSDGLAGLLVKPCDKEGLKAAIVSSATDSKAVRGRVEQAKFRVQKEYSSIAMADKYHTIYRTICTGKHHPSAMSEDVVQ